MLDTMSSSERDSAKHVARRAGSDRTDRLGQGDFSTLNPANGVELFRCSQEDKDVDTAESAPRRFPPYPYYTAKPHR